MKKEQWQSLYDTLSKLLYEFNQSYSLSKNGKNKKIRSKADREADTAIQLATSHIRQNEEAFNLLTGGENKTAFGRTIIYNEFLSFNYFSNDMNDFLKVIRDKIQSFVD